jgi:predicted small lipoprotein YifL
VSLDDRRFLSRVLIAGILVAAVGLAACGRRGPLEPPPSAAATTTVPDDGKAPPPDPGITKPDRPFVLDPLL